MRNLHPKALDFIKEHNLKIYCSNIFEVERNDVQISQINILLQAQTLFACFHSSFIEHISFQL